MNGFGTDCGECLPEVLHRDRWAGDQSKSGLVLLIRQLSIVSGVPCARRAGIASFELHGHGNVPPSDLGYWFRLLRPGAIAAGRDVVGALHAGQAPDDRGAAPGNGIGHDNRLRQGDPPLIAARIRAGHDLAGFGQPSFFWRGRRFGTRANLESSSHHLSPVGCRTPPLGAADVHVGNAICAGAGRATALDAADGPPGRAARLTPTNESCCSGSGIP